MSHITACTAANPLPRWIPQQVRDALLARQEIALLDVREEGGFAQGHPLWAAHLSISRLELEAWGRLPRRSVQIVVYDNGEGLAEEAACRLQALGYDHVAVLEGGLTGWREAGLELFADVNASSKAFGEWVEAHCHTPSLSAQDVQALLARPGGNVVVLDARRFDEYQTMSIPGGISVPGGELVRRLRDLVPDPQTQVIVNCAGRTRSLIGAQSLINASVPNPVAALRNGTIGWTLAGLPLAHGQTESHTHVPVGDSEPARRTALSLARRAGVRRLDELQWHDWREDPQRTIYLLDVRSPEEYAQSHLQGFRNAPGGQLVQETDHHAPVRGARLVLFDDDSVRAAMAGSWLAQMGWEVALLAPELAARLPRQQGPDLAPHPPAPFVPTVSVDTLAAWVKDGAVARGEVAVIDLTTSANHRVRHIPGAWWTVRARLGAALQDTIPPARHYVLTCGSSLLARFALQDVAAQVAAAQTGATLSVLDGGTAAWIAAGGETVSGGGPSHRPR